jgi:hypothetical protein
VFWVSLQLFLKHFSFYDEFSETLPEMYVSLPVKSPLIFSGFNDPLILSKFSETLSEMYVSLHVKSPLIFSGFNDPLNLSKEFRQICMFMKLRPLGTMLYRTDSSRLLQFFENNTQQTQEKNIHAFSPDSKNQAAGDVSLRPHGHRNRI